MCVCVCVCVCVCQVMVIVDNHTPTIWTREPPP